MILFDCLYILAAVISILHKAQSARLIFIYMFVVFTINVFLWKYWGSPTLRRKPPWRRIVRFCAWSIFLITIPALTLQAIDTRSIAMMFTIIYSLVIGVAAFWLSNSGQQAT